MFQSNQITKISCFSSSKRSVTFIPSCSFIRESYSLSSCRHKTETFIIISVVKCKTDAQTELFLTHSFTFFISNSFHQGPSEKWNFRGQRQKTYIFTHILQHLVLPLPPRLLLVGLPAGFLRRLLQLPDVFLQACRQSVLLFARAFALFQSLLQRLHGSTSCGVSLRPFCLTMESHIEIQDWKNFRDLKLESCMSYLSYFCK